jgi:hypothetical protein
VTDIKPPRVNLYLNPVLAYYADMVREDPGRDFWEAPGLSRALARTIRQLGRLLREAEPELSPGEFAYVHDAIVGIMRLKDILPEDIRPDFVRVVAGWSPLAVWALVDRIVGLPIVMAAEQPDERPRDRPPKTVA